LDNKTLPDPRFCNNAVLRSAARRLGQFYDDALEPSGLKATQHVFLSHIKCLGTPTIGELARIMVMDASALRHSLTPLERDGFVRIAADESDRRSKRVTLTESGTAKLGETLRLWQSVQNRFEAAFGKEKAADLREVLSFLASQQFTDVFQLVDGPAAEEPLDDE
jgi:DNA-binding MarR family transcriptional regulator